MRQKGFTLTELMMVVVIIGILATLSIPNYLSSMERSRVAKAVNALELLQREHIRYYNEMGGYAPTINTLCIRLGLDLSNDPHWAYAMGAGPDYYLSASRKDSAGVVDPLNTIRVNFEGDWDTSALTSPKPF